MGRVYIRQSEAEVHTVYYLFNHLSVAAEHGQWRAGVVRSYVVLLPTAHLHGEQMSLIRRKLETL